MYPVCTQLQIWCQGAEAGCCCCQSAVLQKHVTPDQCTPHFTSCQLTWSLISSNMIQGGLFHWYPPISVPKRNPPSSQSQHRIYWNSSYDWLICCFLFGTEIGGYQWNKPPCICGLLYGRKWPNVTDVTHVKPLPLPLLDHFSVFVWPGLVVNWLVEVDVKWNSLLKAIFGQTGLELNISQTATRRDIFKAEVACLASALIWNASSDA